MEKEKCENCRYFRRHYIVDSQRCTPVNCGHCTYPRIKKRTPDTLACGHFEICRSRDLPDREAVVNFLTTDFLQELLKLSLPYEVREEKREGEG